MSRKPSYAEQLKDPRWQKRRLEVLGANDFQCEYCDSDRKTLHVHHLRYMKGRMAWEYKDDELACICEECHERLHEFEGKIMHRFGLCRGLDHAELIIQSLDALYHGGYFDDHLPMWLNLAQLDPVVLEEVNLLARRIMGEELSRTPEEAAHTNQLKEFIGYEAVH